MDGLKNQAHELDARNAVHGREIDRLERQHIERKGPRRVSREFAENFRQAPPDGKRRILSILKEEARSSESVENAKG